MNSSHRAIPICLKFTASGASPLLYGHYCLLCLARPSFIFEFCPVPVPCIDPEGAQSLSVCVGLPLEMPTVLCGRKPPLWNAWDMSRPGIPSGEVALWLCGLYGGLCGGRSPAKKVEMEDRVERQNSAKERWRPCRSPRKEVKGGRKWMELWLSSLMLSLSLRIHSSQIILDH